MDPQVNMKLVEPVCTTEAFGHLVQLQRSKLDNSVYLCKVCGNGVPPATGLMTPIGCDRCLEWFHLTCANLKRTPKAKNWFCLSCQ